MNNTSLGAGDTLFSIRGDVRTMGAYTTQPSAGLVKLDAMENPFRLSPELQTALGARLGALPLNRYPAACHADLCAALVKHADVPPGCSLLLGNGSDEVIAMLNVACCKPSAKLLAPVPSFVMYENLAKLHGLSFVGVPLTPNFELDEAAMLGAIKRHRPALTLIADPNNPTANLFAEGTLAKIVDLVGALGCGLVVFDEAYQPFSSRTWMQRMPRYPHMLVIRTLSKFGLAGVRLGYLAGSDVLIEEINKVRPPYNVGVLNAEAALFALAHADEFARQAEVLRSERERLQTQLKILSGVTPFPSEANMILVRVPDAKPTFEAMRTRGVLVKCLTETHPLLANCLRITVGTPEENSLMLDALKESM